MNVYPPLQVCKFLDKDELYKELKCDLMVAKEQRLKLDDRIASRIEHHYKGKKIFQNPRNRLAPCNSEIIDDCYKDTKKDFWDLSDIEQLERFDIFLKKLRLLNITKVKESDKEIVGIKRAIQTRINEVAEILEKKIRGVSDD